MARGLPAEDITIGSTRDLRNVLGDRDEGFWHGTDYRGWLDDPAFTVTDHSRTRRSSVQGV